MSAAKMDEIMSSIESMTVLELSEFVKKLEEAGAQVTLK